MDASEEKFFEGLVGTTTDADKNYEIELTKAATPAGNVVAETKARTMKLKTSESKETETTWDDGEPEGQLTVDVYQTPSDIIIESAIAGVRPEDIDIQVTADSISIRGSRQREKEASDEDYLYQECYWGRFARSIILPQEVDPENASVSFKNGILAVRLPKVNKKKAKKLRVSME